MRIKSKKKTIENFSLESARFDTRSTNLHSSNTTRQYDIDLYSPEALRNSDEHYKKLRNIAPIVYLPQNAMHAVTTYEAVRAALRADDILISGEGVSANELLNTNRPAIALMSDGETHMRRRNVLMQPLKPRSLDNVKTQIQSSAETLIADLTARDSFCVVADFATHLPVTIVSNLVGLSEYGREHMLDWAAATFNMMGPLNPLGEQALPTALEMVGYIETLTPEQLDPNGWAANVLSAGEDGRLSKEEAGAMVTDYIAPSLDTTILASAHMFWRLAITPDAFEEVRKNPTLVPSVVNESVRLASPIRAFTRYAQSDFKFDGCCIPAGSRALILYASANRDEAHYIQPNEFQLHRNPRDQMAWGHGAHTCVGMHLARMEMEQLLIALLRHARRLTTEEPIMLLNNVLQGFSAMRGSID